MNDLELEIKKLTDRLEYERNMYELQLKGLKEGLIYKVNKLLKIELDDIEIVAERMHKSEGNNEGEGYILKMHLRNIQQGLNTL
jgi:hypothetical protein